MAKYLLSTVSQWSFGDEAVLLRLHKRIEQARTVEAYNPDQPRESNGRWGSGNSTVNQIPQIDYPLSSKLRSVETKFRNQLAADPEKAKADYRQKYGNVLNADNAKEMSPDYQKDRSLSMAVHEPASWLVKQMFKEDLERPVVEGHSNAVMFTAGGAGAGKTTAIEGDSRAKAIFDQAHTIVDGTMSAAKSSIGKVSQALQAGKEAIMLYVHRDPVDAFVNGVLPRAERTGRTVLLDEVAKQYSGIQDSMQAIQDKFGSNPKFAMVVLDNTHGAGNAQTSSLDALPKIPAIRNWYLC